MRRLATGAGTVSLIQTIQSAVSSWKDVVYELDIMDPTRYLFPERTTVGLPVD
jgi:hypothetical protein